MCYSKTCASLCKPVHDIVNYSAITYPFESGKCRKEGKKFLKFLHEITSIVHGVWRAKIQEVQIIDFPEMALRQSDNRNK